VSVVRLNQPDEVRRVATPDIEDPALRPQILSRDVEQEIGATRSEAQIKRIVRG
jgi:hypothetical protein